MDGLLPCVWGGDTMPRSLFPVRPMSHVRQQIEALYDQSPDKKQLFDLACIIKLYSEGYSPWYWDIESNQFGISSGILDRMPASRLNHANQLIDAIHPDDIEMAMRHIYKFIEGYTSNFLINLRMRCTHGGHGTLEWRGVITDRDENGKPTRILGSHICLA